MALPETVESNEQAFRRMQTAIDAQFPAGHWIAIDAGQVIADAPSAEELRSLLIDAGKNPRDVFVVEAGADYPQFATILNLINRRPKCEPGVFRSSSSI